MLTRQLLAVLAATTLALVAVGCEPKRGSESPDVHYEDKQAAIASFEEPERDAWAKPAQVIEALLITPNMDVADIGAGSGYFTRRLATAAHEGTTYAVDVEAEFKSYIQEHRAQWHTPNIVTRLAVYENPLLPVGSVDLVFISNTYSFLQDRETYFTAVYKALRRGGRLAVIDWRIDVECPRWLGCPKPADRVPRETALEELSHVGFTVLAEHDFLEYQYFVVLGRAEDRDRDREREVEPQPSTPAPTPTNDAGVQP